MKEIFVYDGRLCLGLVEKLDGKFVAYTADGPKIGGFESQKRAVAAIIENHYNSLPIIGMDNRAEAHIKELQ
jgi:hypothetical protein